MSKELGNINKYMNEYKLSYKQVLFCMFYSGNASEAARQAGYKQASVQGSRLLGNDKVKSLIDSLTAREQASDGILSREQLMQIWSDLARDTDAGWPARLQATQLLGKAYGAFIDKTAIMAQISVEHLEKYSDKELLEKVSEYMAILDKAGVQLALPRPEAEE
jgi:hypothetical protein